MNTRMQPTPWPRPHLTAPPPTTRRRFLAAGSVWTAWLGLAPATAWVRAQGAHRRLRVGVMGLGRGLAHVAGFLNVPDVEIAYVCDVDERRVAEGLRAVEKRQPSGRCRGTHDFRRILDDPDVDILSIAAPNFWQAPATILACAAGKHVYVEKPGSHNAREAEWMVAAARRFKRQVQMGNQRRSDPTVIEAIEKLRGGIIGPVRMARCWYDANRPSIGRGKPAPVPAWLNWDLWQGPAPVRPFKDNLVHYQWHWHWHYGGGELANNGVHTLDLARWGLGVRTPKQVCAGGGRYHFDDDQETPDSMVVTYEFDQAAVVWDGSSCHPRKADAHPMVTFYGDGGSLAIGGGARYQVFDPGGKEIAGNTGKFTDVPHFQNFVDAIRLGTPLHSEIGDAQQSTLLCHLGNIAFRTAAKLELDSATGRILRNRSAQKLWKREYRRGWEPRV